MISLFAGKAEQKKTCGNDWRGLQRYFCSQIRFKKVRLKTRNEVVRNKISDINN